MRHGGEAPDIGKDQSIAKGKSFPDRGNNTDPDARESMTFSATSKSWNEGNSQRVEAGVVEAEVCIP